MKKIVLFLSFCILLSSLMFGGVTASAEANVRFDEGAMEITYEKPDMQLSESCTLYLAAYANGRMIGVAENVASTGEIELTLSVSEKPDTVKAMYFDANLAPLASAEVFDSSDFKQPEAEDAVTILKCDIYGFDESIGVLEYYESVDYANTITAKVNLSGAIYYNGAVLTSQDISSLGGIGNVFLNADIIELSDCVNDTYNMVRVTEYIFRGVSEVDAEKEYIKFSAYGSVSLGVADRGNENFTYNIYDETGNVLFLSDIKENDVLSFVTPMYNGRSGLLDKVSHLDIYVSDHIVTGMVETKDSNGVYTINGERYWLDSRSYASVSVGDSGTFFITHNGIVYNYIPEPKDNFAIITACGSTGAFETVYQLKLFTKGGEWKALDVARTLSVYEESISSGTYEYSNTVYKRNTGDQDTFFAEIAELVADAASKDEAVAKLCGRMVHYVVDENNEICELYFAGTNVEDFYVQSGANSRYYPDVQIFGDYDLDENSKLFIAPVTEVSTGSFNVAEEDMSVAPFAILGEDSYTAYLYSYCGNDNLGAAIVCDEVAGGFTLAGGIETFDADNGIIIGYEKEGDAQTVEVSVDLDRLSVYYNDTVMTEEEIAGMGGLPKVILGADSICFQKHSNQKYQEIYITQYAKRVVTGIGSGIRLGDEEVSLTAEERGMESFSYVIYDEDGAEIDISSVSLCDIAYIAAPLYNGAAEKFNDVPYLEIHILRNVITGIVKEQVSDAVYNISGAEYESEIALDIGGKYVFHLDKDNVICAVEAVETIDRNYAFITRYGCVTDFGGTYQLQLLTDEGELLAYDVASRLVVYQGEERNVCRSSDGTLDTFFAEIAALLIDETDIAAAQEKQGRRAVIFETNEDGEICELWVAADTGDYYSSHAAARYSLSENSFGGFPVDDTSVLYVAPVKEISTGMYNVEPDDVRVMPVSMLLENETYNAHINVYSEDGYVGAAVTYDDVSLVEKNAHLAVVTRYAANVDAENRDVMQYTFIEGGETKVVNVAFDAEVAEMSVGDVFRYALNANGEIMETQLILDASEAAADGFDDYGLTLSDWSANDIAIVYGKVTDVRTTMLMIDTADMYYTINEAEGNTYALVNCSADASVTVKALSGSAYIQSDYNTVSEYFAVAILGETGRYEDIVQVVFPESVV